MNTFVFDRIACLFQYVPIHVLKMFYAWNCLPYDCVGIMNLLILSSEERTTVFRNHTQ